MKPTSDRDLLVALIIVVIAGGVSVWDLVADYRPEIVSAVDFFLFVAVLWFAYTLPRNLD